MIQSLYKLYKQYGYSAAAVKEAEQVEIEPCAVCLSQLCKGEKVRSLPLCNHRYHADCIGAWLEYHTTCPLCRNKITDLVPQDQHKQVKPFRESMIGVVQIFTDPFVALLSTILPSCITESFPLVHSYF
uniref:RING-type E3 ubiquitin transferase n=1 Tax=Lotus japonicus TaxID=34305 RepID=I3SXU4_LOTJA|nr:unknown [Lotus japonicus]